MVWRRCGGAFSMQRYGVFAEFPNCAMMCDDVSVRGRTTWFSEAPMLLASAHLCQKAGQGEKCGSGCSHQQRVDAVKHSSVAGNEVA